MTLDLSFLLLIVRINLVLISFIALFLFSCNDNGEKTLRTGAFEIRENPASAPRELPTLFVYKGSTPKLAVLRDPGSYFSSPEGMTLFHTKDSVEVVSEFYRKNVEKEGWSIIQSQSSPDSSFIMAESPYQKLVTVIVRQGDPTEIKIYVKQSGTD